MPTFNGKCNAFMLQAWRYIDHLERQHFHRYSIMPTHNYLSCNMHMKNKDLIIPLVEKITLINGGSYKWNFNHELIIVSRKIKLNCEYMAPTWLIPCWIKYAITINPSLLRLR